MKLFPIEIYSEEAEYILKVCQQIKDIYDISSKVISQIKRDEYNSIVIVSAGEYRATNIRKRIGNFIVRCILYICKKPDRFDNEMKTFNIGSNTIQVQVGKAMLLADILKGMDAACLFETYGKNAVDEMIGHPFNPFQVEMMKHAKLESEKIIKDYDTKINELKIETKMKVKNENNIKMDRLNEIVVSLQNDFEAAWNELENSIGQV